MSRIPRLLPLIAIAIVGVFAINFVAGARSLPELVGAARAFAEGALPKDKAKKDKAAAKADAAKEGEGAAEKAASPLPEGSAAMAANLAANADALCSPAEMKYLSDLQERRTQIDAREGDIDTQLKLIEAAEAKLNAKVAELGQLKTDINGLLGQVDAKQAAETARLVKVYSNMKPQQAAATMAALDDDVRLPIAAQMKELNLSAILNKMTPPQAKDLTEKLAQRYGAAKAVTQARAATAPGAPAQAAGPTPATPAAPAQAAAPAKPGAQQQAAAPAPAKPAAQQQAATEDKAAPAKPKAKPAPKKQVARKAPTPAPKAAAPSGNTYPKPTEAAPSSPAPSPAATTG